MGKKYIQSPGEILMFQGDEFTRRIPILDAEGVAVDLTSGVTDIKLEAFEFLDDTTAKLEITGTVYDDGSDGMLQFVFTSALTANLNPQTYAYYVKFTKGTEDITSNRDLLSIKRSQI